MPLIRELTGFFQLGRLANSGRQLPAVKVGIQLGIFKTLTAAKTPLSLVELSKPAGADPKLVGRITRYLTALNLIKETGKQTYVANKTTEILAQDSFQGGMEFFQGVS